MLPRHVRRRLRGGHGRSERGGGRDARRVARWLPRERGARDCRADQALPRATRRACGSHAAAGAAAACGGWPQPAERPRAGAQPGWGRGLLCARVRFAARPLLLLLFCVACSNVTLLLQKGWADGGHTMNGQIK
eukprot:357500-Chlamydomonas_euryale.AAC.13